MNATNADFQLTGDWPIAGGSLLIPVGTFLSLDDWQWQGVELPPSPPVTCLAISQRGYNKLLQFHEGHRILSLDLGIVRKGDPEIKDRLQRWGVR